MATVWRDAMRTPLRGGYWRALSDPARAIGGPRFDFLLFWGVPLLALLATLAWWGVARQLPPATADRTLGVLFGLTALLTYAHLVAVVPRAYLNAEVFESNRRRLTIVPVLLIVGLLAHPAILVVGTVIAVFWDVHHSAMQTFGLSRIYDMKAGNDPHLLRATDLRLNWALYVGPLIAGASLMYHVASLGGLGTVGLTQLAAIPGLFTGHLGAISIAVVAALLAVLIWSAVDYARAMRAGYRLPAHKLALIGVTGLVSIVAWGFLPPLIALAAINIFHAIQYFGLVWLKEGGRMSAFAGGKGVPQRRRVALIAFLLACAIVALGYCHAADTGLGWVLAPFIACSLLHFWFDSFVWSVRRRQV